jgi:hypothetical protein
MLTHEGVNASKIKAFVGNRERERKREMVVKVT